MKIQEILDLIHKELEKQEIYPASRYADFTCPKSRYYGRYRSDLLQIRVSDHEKPYPPNKVEINIIVQDGMSEQEVIFKLKSAIQDLTKEEDMLYEDDN